MSCDKWGWGQFWLTKILGYTEVSGMQPLCESETVWTVCM